VGQWEVRRDHSQLCNVTSHENIHEQISVSWICGALPFLKGSTGLPPSRQYVLSAARGLCKELDIVELVAHEEDMLPWIRQSLGAGDASSLTCSQTDLPLASRIMRSCD
jgi:hypothetical protein